VNEAGIFVIHETLGEKMGTEKVSEFKTYLQEIISGNAPGILGTRAVFNNTPSKKISTIISVLKIFRDEEIIIFFDDSLMGSGKEGLVITSWGLHYNVTKIWHIPWSDIAEKFCYFEVDGFINKKLKIRNGQGNSFTEEREIALTMASFDVELLKKIIITGSKIFTSKKNVENQTVNAPAANNDIPQKAEPVLQKTDEKTELTQKHIKKEEDDELVDDEDDDEEEADDVNTEEENDEFEVNEDANQKIEQIIKEKIVKISGAFVAPSISPKKLTNAATYIAQGIDPSFIIAIIDNTLFGSAKEGYVFTCDTMYYKGFLKDSLSIPYNQMSRTKCKIVKETDNEGKVTTKKVISIYDKNNNMIFDDYGYSSDKNENISELLNAIISEYGKECDKSQAIENSQDYEDDEANEEEDCQAAKSFNWIQIEQIIKEKIVEVSEYAYLASSISPDKFNNAAHYIAPGSDPNAIIAIIDNTLFGSAKNGYVFTFDAMYFQPFLGNGRSIPYSQIGGTGLLIENNINKICIYDKSNNMIFDDASLNDDNHKLSELLNAIILEYGKESDKSQTMEEMIKRGDKALKNSEGKKALFYYSKALEIDNTLSEIYCKRVDAYVLIIKLPELPKSRMEDYSSKAVLDINESIKCAKDNEEMAYCLKQKGKFLKIFTSLSDNDNFLFEAKVFWELCEYEKAAEYLIKTLELDTMDEEGSSSIFLEYVQKFIELDKFEEAVNISCLYLKKYADDYSNIKEHEDAWDEIMTVLSDKGYKDKYEAIKKTLKKSKDDFYAEKNQTASNEGEESNTGILGGIVNAAIKGYGSYQDAIKKEKEKMEKWPDKRLAFMAQKKQVLPAGMAAMQILKERGYNASQIAKM
jgi:hypothetical protein